MEKIEALESVRRIWLDEDIPLGEKAMFISSDFYSAGLDLEATAAFLRTTPSELDFLLGMGELDDALRARLSDANPPKTTWAFFACASEGEISNVLDSLASGDYSEARAKGQTSQFAYSAAVEVAVLTPEQRVAELPGDILGFALKKSEDFDALDDWQKKFLKSIVGQRKRKKVLTDKQSNRLYSVLNDLASKGVIVRNSIDGDQKECDEILDALGR